eukprot:UN07972
MVRVKMKMLNCIFKYCTITSNSCGVIQLYFVARSFLYHDFIMNFLIFHEFFFIMFYHDFLILYYDQKYFS